LTLPLLPPLSFHSPRPHRPLHSFPPRRSSDLVPLVADGVARLLPLRPRFVLFGRGLPRADCDRLRLVDRLGFLFELGRLAGEVGDRKSTRLNSSHVEISYAVFCLKKKTNTKVM